MGMSLVIRMENLSLEGNSPTLINRCLDATLQEKAKMHRMGKYLM